MSYCSLNETINWKSCFCFFTDGKHHKACELDMITQKIMLCGHYYQPPWVSLTRLLYNLQLWCHRHWFRKFTVCFHPIRKEILSLISYVNFQIFPSAIIFILILMKVIKEAIKKLIWIFIHMNWLWKFNKDF